MRNRIIFLLGFLITATSLSLSGQPEQIFGQSPQQVPVQRQTLTSKDDIKEMQPDESAVTATGLPLADLIIKDMCFEQGQKGGLNTVRVLVANVGSVDAGPFELGFKYLYEDGTGKLAVDKIDGLKAGEEKWKVEGHICCGLGPWEYLVDSAVKYQAIADPKYRRANPMHVFESYEVKSVIPESNERNNQMSANKSELRPCTVIRKLDRSAPPKIQPVIPPRP